jgi:hypothetical protein
MTDTPPRAGYALHSDRCVVEVTRRPFLRARFRAVDGTLTLDGERSLTMAVAAGKLRPVGRWLGPALRGPKHVADGDTITFESISVADWAFTGRLTVHGAWYPLTLHAREVHADPSTVVLAAVGRTGRVRVEIAAEFGR